MANKNKRGDLKVCGRAENKKDGIYQRSFCSFCNKTQMLIMGTAFLMAAALALYFKQLAFFRIERPYTMIPLNVVMKSTAAAGIVILSYVLRNSLRFFGYIGDISYSLYLMIRPSKGQKISSHF